MEGGGDEVGKVAKGGEAFSGSVSRSDTGLSEENLVGGFKRSAPQGSFAIAGGGGA